MDAPLLTLEELSRLLDNELSEDERKVVTDKLTNCSTSEQLLNRLRELTQEVAQSILTAEHDFTADETEECLTEEEIIQIVEHKAAPTTLLRVEQHIANCRRCLLLIMQNIRTTVSMNANNWQELPDNIKSDSRVKVVSKIKRPTHCIERTNEQIGELRIDLNGNKTQVSQEFGKGRYATELVLKKANNEVANLEVLYTYNKHPKSQIEILLSDKQDNKQVFRGITGLNGKVLIRRLQQKDYTLYFKDLDAVVSIIIQ